MTGTNSKLRSLFLATLMVVSVFGGTMAFAGTAAAANSVNAGAGNSGSVVGNAAVDPASVTEGTTTDNHLITFTATDVSADGGTDTVNVTFDNAAASGLSVNGVTAETPGDNSVSITSSPNLVDGPDGDGVDDTIQFAISPDDGGTVDVEFEVDVTTQAPQVNSDTTVDIDATISDSDGSSATNTFTLTVIDTDQTTNGFLSGRVSDQNNNNIGNATVIAERQSDGLESSTTTNSNGEYTLELPTGDYDITVVREGFETANSKDNTVAADSTTSANLVITRIINPDDIQVVSSDPVAVADGTDQVSYTVLVTTNDTADGPFDPLEGVQVDATAANAPASFAFDSASGTTNSSGLLTFTATSSDIGEADLTFTEQSNANSVDDTATFRPERGDANLQGEVVDNESNVVENAVVWVAYQGENQTLAFAQENQPFLVSDVNAEGKYTIEGIVDSSEGSGTEVNVYVLANGFNRLDRTGADVGTFVAADETETVFAGETENHDFTVFPGGPPQEYRLDVTVNDGQKSVRVPAGSTVTATVTLEGRPLGSSDAYQPVPNQDLFLNTTNNGPLDDDVNTLTTDSNGTATVALSALNAGTTNLTASTENSEGDEYTTTGSEQAEVTVFEAAELTGDVVNEDDEELAAGQATVELFVRNNAGNFESTGRVSQIGSSGSYVFTNIQSGEQYRVVATTVTGLSGQATTVPNIPAGTTTNDIVVVGAEPNPAEFQVSDLNPQDVTVTQGANITITANITNAGVVDATKTVEFRVGGTAVASQQVSLNGSETKQVTFENVSTSTLASGTYTHGVYTPDDSQTATLTVEGSGNSSVVAQYDTNNNGQIEIGELGVAAADYSNGELGIAGLGQVAAAYSS
jgi:surface glycoprotein (TIGR04207 family)